MIKNELSSLYSAFSHAYRSTETTRPLPFTPTLLRPFFFEGRGASKPHLVMVSDKTTRPSDPFSCTYIRAHARKHNHVSRTHARTHVRDRGKGSGRVGGSESAHTTTDNIMTCIFLIYPTLGKCGFKGRGRVGYSDYLSRNYTFLENCKSSALSK